jgi:hypothetical protein
MPTWFFSRTLWGVVGGVLYTLLVFHWGDAYGPRAQAYAAVEADLRAKNAVLTKQLESDAETVAAERTDAAAKLSEFEKAAATFQNKCPLDQTQVDALNKLIGG